MKNIEMHIIPDPYKMYVLAKESLLPLQPINKDFFITPQNVGRVFTSLNDDGIYLLPRELSDEELFHTTMHKGHALLQTLVSLQGNDFVISTDPIRN
jgi:hypothetical protein